MAIEAVKTIVGLTPDGYEFLKIGIDGFSPKVKFDDKNGDGSFNSGELSDKYQEEKLFEFVKENKLSPTVLRYLSLVGFALSTLKGKRSVATKIDAAEALAQEFVHQVDYPLINEMGFNLLIIGALQNLYNQWKEKSEQAEIALILGVMNLAISYPEEALRLCGQAQMSLVNEPRAAQCVAQAAEILKAQAEAEHRIPKDAKPPEEAISEDLVKARVALLKKKYPGLSEEALRTEAIALVKKDLEAAKGAPPAAASPAAPKTKRRTGSIGGGVARPTDTAKTPKSATADAADAGPTQAPASAATAAPAGAEPATAPAADAGPTQAPVPEAPAPAKSIEGKGLKRRIVIEE